MRPIIRAALWTLLAAAAIPALAKKDYGIEVAEATMDMLSLPSTENGILVIKACEDCRERTLQATASTEYRIGRTQVSLGELTRFARLNGGVYAAVHYEEASSKLLRIVASEPAASR